MKSRYIFLLLLFFGGALQAENAKSLFEEANRAFQEKNYAKAIELYHAIEGKHSATYYFNLGNAYYQNNQIGYAILNYEKAKRLNPRLSDLEYNLIIAQNRRKDNIQPIPPFFLEAFWSSIHKQLKPMAWAILGILTLLVSVGGIAFWLMRTDRKEKKIGFFVGVGLAILGVVLLLLGYSQHRYIYQSKDAIIVATTVDFKDGADADSNTTQTLHEGTAVECMEAIGTWQKVRLPNGEVGWLPEDSFEKTQARKP